MNDDLTQGAVLIAIGLMVGAVGVWRRRVVGRRHLRWEHAFGEVVDERLASAGGGSGHRSFAPVVVFRTATGQTVRGAPRTSSWNGISRIGRRIDVFYDPARPDCFDTRFGRLDRPGTWWLAAAGVLSALGALLVVPALGQLGG